MTQVVTYESSGGARCNVCPACEYKLLHDGQWPRDERGEEICQVYHGLHRGPCDVCGLGQDARGP